MIIRFILRPFNVASEGVEFVMVMRVTVDDNRLPSRQKRRTKELRNTLRNLTKEHANSGAQYAASIAPKQTRALVEGIKAEPDSSNGDRNSWMIVSRTPRNKGGNNPYNKPYHWFLHLGMRGWAKGMRKSGMHNYMDITAGWVRRSYYDNAKKGVRKSMK